jgi:hypothetical protein
VKGNDDKLTSRCDYFDPTSLPIRTGEGVVTDEMCNAVTFHLPSTTPRLCFDHFLVP